MRNALLISLALLSPGCALARLDVNEPLQREAVEGLKPGLHTAADVARLLGGPTEVVQLGRRSAYRYDHRTEKRTGLWLILVGFAGSDERSDRVWTFFDENELLTHVGSTFESGDAQYELPFLGEDDH